MNTLPAELKTRLLSYIRQQAPYSIVDRGMALAATDSAIECHKTGSKIHGVVTTQDDNSESFSVELEVISSNKIFAHCTCSSDEDMNEQWCAHAVGLLWKGCELGFFSEHAGFPETESTYRMNTSSPQEIARIIDHITAEDLTTVSTEIRYIPEVEVWLDVNSDRIGVQVRFDGNTQAPRLFEGFSESSSRTLDNFLIETLDNEGHWDDEKLLWYVNSSSEIDTILGLIREYDNVYALHNKESVHVAEQSVDARLVIEWMESSVRLSMEWVLPSGEKVERRGDIFGTGPYWVEVKNTIYKLLPEAAKISSIFPHSPTLTVPRVNVGPILEAITRDLPNDERLLIINKKLQPQGAITTPKVRVTLSQTSTQEHHFGSSDKIQITATVEFMYPTPPEGDNIVYLTDRETEALAEETLRTLGFEETKDIRSWKIEGDRALDLIQVGRDSLPKKWDVSGLEAIAKGIRFSKLSLDVSLSSSGKDAEESNKIDWFDCRISLTQNNANVPISTLFKRQHSDQDRWIQLDSGAYAPVPGGSVGRLKASLGMLDSNYRLSNTIKAKLTAAQALSLGKGDDESYQVKSDQKLKALQTKLRNFTAIKKIKPNKKFEGTLRSYQLEGISWLNFLNDFRFGGILADEMGLGKTVQTLALVQYLKHTRAKDKKLHLPSMIVAPTSVITNWLYEARKFTPDLKVLLLHGPERKAYFHEIPNFDLVITSYALLRIDKHELQRHKFGYVILDEAQNIKNPQAATTRAAKTVQCEHRLALSGTPTENRPLELWSIMDFLMPGYLGSQEFFRAQIEKPILDNKDAEEVARLLRARTSPFILRRTKAEVEKDLPPKMESELHVQMTQSQQEVYLQVLEEVRPKVFAAVDKQGIRGATVSILAALMRLRQICNHPNSVDVLKEMEGYDSGKFQALKDLITEALESNRKILVFCQFREMLAIIRRWVEESNINYLYLDGTTRNRQELIDKFNEDESTRLFLMSLKAGGTGVNLTAADTIIIYDPWWNPAVESQAVDRAHRIGQTKAVTVYRLVTDDSIEQKMMKLKEKKSAITEALLSEQDFSPLSLTRDELDDLFNPFSANISKKAEE